MAKQDSGKAYKQNLQDANQFARNLKDEMMNLEGVSESTRKKMAEMAGELKGQVDISDKINTLIQERNTFIEEEVKNGRIVSDKALEYLDTEIELLKKEKEINDIKESQKGILQEILGIDSDIEEAIVSGGMKVLFLNKAFENVSANVSRMYEGVKSNVTELGLAGGEAMKLQGNIEMASFSLTGFLYGTDAVAASAKAITEEYGNVNAATTDLIKGVTEVASLTGDASTALKITEAFESAGVEAGDVKDKISDIAKEAGVSGQLAVKGLGDQMHRLVGASEEELELIIKGNIELQKRGMTMSEIEDLSNNMLDIETSMRNEAKARAMFGRDIGANEMRSLSLQLQTAKTEEERTRIATQMSDLLMEKVGSAEEFNNMSLKEQQIMAQSYGMSVEDLATKIQTTEKQKELTEKYGEYAGLVEGAQGFLAMGASAVGNMTLEMVKLIAKTAVMNMMMGKGAGFGNLKDGVKGMFGKGGGGGSVPGLSQTQDAGGQAGQAAQGSGGGLKSLADGLREMGDGKVLAGVGVVALAGPAFVIALPSIPFLLFMGKVKLKALEENFAGLGKGLAEMPQGALGALTMMLVGPALALGTLAIPFLLFMSIPGTGPLMQANFTALAAGLAAFGNPGTAVFVLIGIGLMAALGVAMIPFAYSLSLLTPLLEAFGNIVVGVMAAIPPIIQAIADGFVTMLGAITPETVLGLMMLGPALTLASFGMIAFSAALLAGGIMSFFGGGLVDDIVRLGTVGPGVKAAGDGLASVAENIGVITSSMSGLSDLVTPLYALSGGLYSISGGLVAIAGAGLLALPTFAALTALAAIAPVLTGLGEFFGMGGGDSAEVDSSDSSDKELLDEIKGLRNDIKAQPIVLNIDGKAVQKITRVQSRQGVSTRGFS